MTEENKQKVATEAELQASIAEASAKADWKQVSKLAGQLVSFQKEHEASELKAKQEAVASLSIPIRDAIRKFLEEKYIKSGKLNLADGVWFNWDFGDQNPSVALLKAKKATTHTTSGTGGGKKYDVKTADMVAEFADKVFGDGENGTLKAPEAYKGMTVKEASEHKATDQKNWDYQLRVALLKAKGVYQK
jgi:hypothetical protein